MLTVVPLIGLDNGGKSKTLRYVGSKDGRKRPMKSKINGKTVHLMYSSPQEQRKPHDVDAQLRLIQRFINKHCRCKDDCLLICAFTLKSSHTEHIMSLLRQLKLDHPVFPVVLKTTRIYPKKYGAPKHLLDELDYAASSCADEYGHYSVIDGNVVAYRRAKALKRIITGP